MRSNRAIDSKIFGGRKISRSQILPMPRDLAIFGLFCLVASGCRSSIGISPQGSPLGGVVFEQVSEGTALAAAGIQAGDVLVSWSREDPATGVHEQGDIRTGFDWLWLKEEQAPRGPVKLDILAGGKSRRVEVGMGRWVAEVRPQLPPKQAQAYMQGVSLIQEGTVDQGVALISAVITEAESQADRSVQSWLYIRIGRAWSQAKNFSAALTAFQSSLAAAPDELSREVCWSLVAETYRNQSEFEKAEDAYRSGLSIRGDSQHSLWVATLMANIATMALQQGDLATVVDFGDRAIRIRRELAPNSFAMLQSLNTMGNFYWHSGDLRQADKLFEDALSLQQIIAPNPSLTAGLLNNLGLVAWSQNDLRRAENYLRQSLSIREEVNPASQDTADSLYNLGNVAYTAEQYDAAEEYRKRALAIQEKIDPDGIMVANILNALGNISAVRHQTEEAMRYHERALDIYNRRAPNSTLVAISLQSIGSTFRDTGKPDKAIEYLEKALRIRESLSPYSAELAMILYLIGGIHRDLGEDDVANRYYERSMETLEHQTEQSSDADSYSSATLRERLWSLYRDATELLASQGKAADAFDVLERGRARSLSHLLANRDLTRSEDIPEEIEAEREALSLRHEELTLRIAELQLPEETDEWTRLSAELKQVNFKYEETIERIREISPRSAGLNFPKPYSLLQVQRSLDPGTLLLSYSIGKDRGDVFAVRSDGLIRVARISVGWQKLYDQLDALRPLRAPNKTPVEGSSSR